MFNSPLRATLVLALAFVTIQCAVPAHAQLSDDSARAKGQGSRVVSVFTPPAAGDIESVVGNGSYGVSGDNGPATAAEITNPYFMTFDASGNLYFADSNASVVRKVNASTGVITTVAGTAWSSGNGGDSGPATSATLNYPVSVALDSAGNLYIADVGGNRIRMVATGTGTITTVAGTGTPGFSGDSGAPTAAELNQPFGIAFDSSGNLYIADNGNNRIRKITPNAGVIATGIITTVAGTGIADYNGDGIAATTADLNGPSGLAVDASGNIYVTDSNNSRVREITKSSGLISTIAGTGNGGDSASSATATTAATSVDIAYPLQVAVDGAGNVYFADAGANRVDKVAVTTGYFALVAGNGQYGFNGATGPAISTELNSPTGVAVDPSGNVFIVDSDNSLIREVAPGTSTQTATPYFSLHSGKLTSGQTVEILDQSPSPAIYYTTDGSTPTTSSTVYSSPIAITTPTTINAIAQASSLTVSLEATAAYTIKLPVAATPTFSPLGGNFTSAQNVTITDSSPGVTIYYTLDGSFPSTSSAVYTAPIHISTPTLLYAIAAGTGYQDSDLGDEQYEIYLNPPTAPTFSPPAGTYTGTQNVSINSTGFSNCYYTTDGTTPTTSSAEAVSLIPVTSNMTIKAICAIPGWPNSPVASASYTIVPLPAPTFSPAPGTYNGVQTVTLSDTNPSVQIYYTTDGSTPTSASNEYFSSQGIRVTATETIKAIAYLTSTVFSSVTSATYTISNLPGFSPPAGTYTSAQSVTITDSMSGAAIYYTTNGSTPVIGNPATLLYTGPITVSSTETIQAIAVVPGSVTTPAVSALYTINLSAVATPTFSPAAGNYTSMPSVTIGSTTPGATITFTTNGTTPTTSSPVYTGPFLVRSAQTIKAIAAKSGYSNSAVATAAYTLTAATPTFSVVAGIYTSAQTVNIASATPGAAIYYTTNGATPTTSSTMGGTNIAVSSSETLKAIAVLTGFTNSAVATAAYTINFAPAATPTFSPAAGTYTSVQSVTLSDTTPGKTIYYTTDGTTPTTSSAVYGAPISVSSSETIKAIATASGYTTSATASAAYTINLPAAATPTFSPAAGTYSSYQTVTINDTTTGAIIYYTTDGTTPTTSSPHSGVAPVRVPVNSSMTIKAIAGAVNYTASTVASATYTLTAATPTFSPAAGTYTAWKSVTLSDATLGSVIYYTTDGTTPTAGSTVYAHPITVSSTQTIKAIAIATSNGYNNSAVASATYTLNLTATPTPTISPAGGPFVARQTVTLSDSASGAIVYYTTNGSTPTTASPQYGGPFVVTSTETVKAIAVVTNDAPSAIASATFNPAAAAPTFSPVAGPYIGPQTVSFGDATTGAVIYFTTNGVTPTTSSTKYTSPITVSSSETIEAIAVATGVANSAVASAAYTLTAATPTFATPAGSYVGTVTLGINDTTPGVTIYYTTNGATPTTASTKYTAAIPVASTETVKAIAVATGYSNSAAASAAYTIDPYKVSTVSAVLPRQTQTITIAGSGFGTSGTSAGLYFYDNTGGWAAGNTACPTLCLAVSSWTDKQIVISGITGSAYGVSGKKLNNADNITLTVANAQGLGGVNVQCKNIVVGAGPTTCTSGSASSHPAPLTATGTQPRKQ